jgi:TolB-like protein
MLSIIILLRNLFNFGYNPFYMSGIIEGYNYDIFISYRQKDNKGDRWVSEFVEALKTELESTFKEEVSVYFDINPHDGLLETHDVDASLKDKLRCLVFIPVISRTYCDPRSFAWEHEFVVFIEQASADRFGLKIKLPNGNFATRILPVRIYELEQQDTRLCESVMGGPLRGIDFIYKSPGVNRPLRIFEDNPKDNLNHTFYRDQINKLANAIRELIQALKTQNSEEPHKTAEKKLVTRNIHIFPEIIKSRILRTSVIVFSIVAVLILFYFLFSDTTRFRNELSIAVLPLMSVSDDYNLIDAGDNFVEALDSKLEKIKRLTVIPRLSTLQYRNTELPLKKIRKDLKANYLVDGRIRKENDSIRVWIELSGSRHNKMLWSSEYCWTKEKINTIANEITAILTDKIQVSMSDEEREVIYEELTGNADANLNYLTANASSNDSKFYFYYDYISTDTSGFLTAIRLYDKAIDLEPAFAEAYLKRAIATAWGYYTNQLDSTYIARCKNDIDTARSLNKDLPDLPIALGFYNYFCVQNLDSALVHFQTAARLNPSDYQPLFYMSLVLRRKGDWTSSRKLVTEIVRFNPREALFLTNIAMTYMFMHEYDSANMYHQKAIDLMPMWRSPYVNKINTLLLKSGKTAKPSQLVRKVFSLTGDSLIEYRIKILEYRKNYREALNLVLKSRSADFDSGYERIIEIAKLYRLLGDDEKAKLYYESAARSLEESIVTDPGNYYLHGLLGVAYAGLKNNMKAIEEGLKAVNISRNNAMDNSEMKMNLALIYTMIGDNGGALDTVESLLQNPSPLSTTALKYDPKWQPLMDLPEFINLLEKY